MCTPLGAQPLEATPSTGRTASGRQFGSPGMSPIGGGGGGAGHGSYMQLSPQEKPVMRRSGSSCPCHVTLASSSNSLVLSMLHVAFT